MLPHAEFGREDHGEDAFLFRKVGDSKSKMFYYMIGLNGGQIV